jgi:hypothetical protein
VDARCARETERVPPRACTVLPRAPLSAPLRVRMCAPERPLRAHARTCSTLLQCGCAGLCPAARACGERSATARVSDGRESVIPTHPSHHPFPPRHSQLLPLAGLAAGRRCSSRRAPRPAHPATASSGQWFDRRTSAHGCRPGPRRLPARPARGGCRHGRPAACQCGGCWHALAVTAYPRLLHENGSENALTVIQVCPKQTK